MKKRLSAKKKTKNKIINNLSQALKLVKENRNYAYFAAFVLSLFFAIGYVFPNFMLELQKSIMREILKEIPADNIFSTMFSIVVHNLEAAAILLFTGVFIIIPFFAIAVNGYFVGAVLHSAIEKAGIPIILRLVPHGIFEIPAVCIAAGFGMKIAVGIFRNEDLKENYKKGFLVFIFIVIPLLIIAGIIEGILFYIEMR